MKKKGKKKGAGEGQGKGKGKEEEEEEEEHLSWVPVWISPRLRRACQPQHATSPATEVALPSPSRPQANPRHAATQTCPKWQT